MTIEQLGMLAKNRYPDNPEYKGKSDREVGEFLTTKHRAYRGRREVDFAKREEEPTVAVEKEPVIEKKYPHMPEGYRPEGVVQYDKPIGPEEKKPSATEMAVTVPKDVGVGIAKGVASSFLGLASLPHAAGKYLAEKVTGKPAPEVFQKTIRQKVEETGALEAKGTWEKIGKGGEQLAEFFAPTPVGKSKAVSKGIDIINKLKKPASVTKVADKVAPVVSRMAKEGAKFGAVVAVQEGEIEKEAKQAAAIGAVIPVVGAVTKGVIKPISDLIKSQKAPVQEKIWTNVMSRTKEEILANPIAGDVAKLGIAKTTKQKILNEMAKVYNNSRKAIESAIVKKEQKVNVKDIDVKKLEDKIWGRVGTVRTPTKLVESEIKEMQSLFDNIKRVTNIYVRGREKISLREAYQLQLSIAREIEKSIVKTDVEKTKIAKAIVDELSESVSKLMPGVKEDVHKIAILQQAIPAMEKSIATGKAAQVNLTEDAALAVAGIMSGTGPVPLLGRHVVFSTAAKTGFSNLINTFNKLPSTEKIPFYLGLKGIFAGYVENFVSKD